MSARIYALASGTFAVGTSGYIVGGILLDISRGLGVTPTVAGQLVTIFAIAYAVSAPLLAVVTGRWDRRRLLVAALVLAGVSDGLAAAAPNFPLLMVARAFSAFGAGVYTPTAIYAATELSPPHRRGRAVAIVYVGLTSSLLLGVPVLSAIGAAFGYRSAFGLLATVDMLAAAVVRLVVPGMAAPPIIRLRERLAVAADRQALTVLSMTLLTYLAVVSVYTYIGPLLAATAGVMGAMASLLLLTYGLGAVVGNAVGGTFTDRYGSRRPLVVSFGGLALAVATLPLTTVTPVGAGIALFVWGIFAWSVNPPLYSWLAKLSPTSGGLLLSLNASAIYVGAALAGAFGGLVIGWSGVLLVPPLAAVIGVAALGVLLVLARPSVPPSMPGR